MTKPGFWQAPGQFSHYYPFGFCGGRDTVPTANLSLSTSEKNGPNAGTSGKSKPFPSRQNGNTHSPAAVGKLNSGNDPAKSGGMNQAVFGTVL
jgi:hypothetical protein